MAADGTARIAPTTPSSSLPMSSATMTDQALTPTCRSMILRHEDVAFDELLHAEIDDDEDPGVHRQAAAQEHRRNRRDDGPDDRDELAEGGEQAQDVEVRHAEQLEGRSVAVTPMIALRSSWPFSHAPTLCVTS